jgi:sec-independent protein translocase protein TatA
MPFDGAFSPIHWLIVAVVALLVLGPDRLPDAARSAAKAWRDFQQVRGTLLGHLRDIAGEVVPSEPGGPASVDAHPDTNPPPITEAASSPSVTLLEPHETRPHRSAAEPS